MSADTKRAPIGRARMLHTMLRVADLGRSLEFYLDKLGMQLLRRQDFPEQRFTLAFVGYGEESATTVLELTHNWDTEHYVPGNAFGHVAIGVADVYASVAALAGVGVRVTRPAGPLKGDPREVIAFIDDPDGYRIELIERRAWLA
jgi:lactoylglutathione lyase